MKIVRRDGGGIEGVPETKQGEEEEEREEKIKK